MLPSQVQKRSNAPVSKSCKTAHRRCDLTAVASRIRVVLADDHPIFARGLRQTLEPSTGIDVVAEARDGETALAVIRRYQPHVAVLDLDMPLKDGFEVVRSLTNEGISSAVIFLTMHNNASLIQAALDLGVQGYLLKDSALSEVVQAVTTVAAGNAFASPVLTNHVFAQRMSTQALLRQHPGLNALTPTERRVLKMIGGGKSSAEIADAMCISIRTLEHHRAHICDKLGLSGRDALLRFALTNKPDVC